MSYQPSIEDVAQLAMDQPERFSSVQTTLRSIKNAMQADEVQRQALETTTARHHYQDYLTNGGAPLTESPIPPLPVLEGPAHDTEFGGVCVDCASLTPCIKKVEVVCHGGENHRVTLQGQKELENTDGKIYFVADKAVSGELSFEGFLRGTAFKDEGTVTITLVDDCPHDAHTLTWTEERSGTPITSGAEIPFTVETNPRPTLLNLPRLGDDGIAFEAATIILDIIMNRAVMVKEETFSISYDGTRDFLFTSVTVPSLKFEGKVSVQPPRIGTEHIPRSEARRLRGEFGMGSNPRQVTHEQGWQIDAQIDVTCGSNTKEIKVGKYRSETTTYDSASSLRDQERVRQQSSSIDRFIGSLTNSAKSLAKNLSTEHDDEKLINLFTVGPKLGIEAKTEQAEATNAINAPALTWTLELGLSVAFAFGVKVDIYQALKRSLRRLPVVTPLGGAAHALLVFLEDAEKGRNWGVARYQISPFLFIEVSLAAGFKASEAASSDATLSGTYDFFKREFDEATVEGQIEIKLTAKAVGGIMGYFDSILTEERVFRYEAEIATEGGIRIKTDNGSWGYQLYHKGASIKIKSFKKVNVESGGRQSKDGGYPASSSSSQVTRTITTTEWVEDSGNTNTYPLAEGYTGEFIPFS